MGEKLTGYGLRHAQHEWEGRPFMPFDVGAKGWALRTGFESLRMNGGVMDGDAVGPEPLLFWLLDSWVLDS
jgi:hypothetical protein